MTQLFTDFSCTLAAVINQSGLHAASEVLHGIQSPVISHDDSGEMIMTVLLLLLFELGANCCVCVLLYHQVQNPAAPRGEPPKSFTFDTVFAPGSKQTDVYNQTARPIVDAVMEGYNGKEQRQGSEGPMEQKALSHYTPLLHV